MKKHSKYAGNLGDVIKHATLTEFIARMDGTYVETHAGFPSHEFDDMVNEDDGFDSYRKLGIGYLLRYRPLNLYSLGDFGNQVVRSRIAKNYLGSIPRVFDAVAIGRSTFNRIIGFDINPEVVEAYNAMPIVDIRHGEGYEGYKKVPDRSVVFCDPFWGTDENLREIYSLINSEPSIVWYPIIELSEDIRKHFVKNPEIGFFEMSLCDPVWGGQGYGMAFTKLPPLNVHAAMRNMQTLATMYGVEDVQGGKTHVTLTTKIPY